MQLWRSTSARALFAACAVALASAANAGPQPTGDNILSGNIKEADGTTGQDTNTGAGVKTGQIQDGAVTDSKITGPISASKLQRTRNLIIVAKDGTGHFTDPVAAMNSITDASASNPYVVQVMPGVYDLAVELYVKSHVTLAGSGERATTLTGMGGSSGRPILLLVGSWSAVRDITIQPRGTLNTRTTAVYGDRATSVRLENVTILVNEPSLGEYTQFAGVELEGGTDHYLSRLKIQIEAHLARAYGIQLNPEGPSVIDDSSIHVNAYAAYGITLYTWLNPSGPLHGDVTIQNTSVTAATPGAPGWAHALDATHNTRIVCSSFVSTTGPYSQQPPAIVARLGYDVVPEIGIAHSQIMGGITAYNGAVFRCFGNYDGNFAAVTCP